MRRRSRTRERYHFDTPEPLIDAALAICVELDREYPFLAHLQLENDGTYTLNSLETIKRSISPHYGEMLGRTGWDVDWIERDKTYCYHQSSGGGSLRREVSGIYWRHPALLHLVRETTARYCDRAFRKRNKTRRIRRIPISLIDPYGCGEYEDLMAWLESTAIDCSVYYCTICKEYLPDREEDYCAHVWWCDEDATLHGKGAEDPEPCESEDCWSCNRVRTAVY